MAQVAFITTLLAVAYGIIHDQITARLCIEYFSVAHPPLIPTDSPTLLAFAWGTLATVWIGAILGLFLALVSQSDGRPGISIKAITHHLSILLACMAASAFTAGLLGFELASHSIVSIPADFGNLIPPAHHIPFMAVWFAHGASYLAGIGGGAFLIFRIWTERGRPRVMTLAPNSPASIIRAVAIIAIATVIIYFRFRRS